MTREVFWNIGVQSQTLFYLLSAVASAIFFAGVIRLVAVWRSTWGERRARPIGESLRRGLIDGLLGSQIFRGNPLGGFAHFAMSWGWILLFIGTCLLTIHHDFYPFLFGPVYLIYSFILDAAGAFFIAGVLALAVRRFVLRSNDVHTRWDDPVYLVLLFAIAATGFLVEGLRIWSISTVGLEWSPVGDLVGVAIDGNRQASQSAHGVIWWVHSLAALSLIAYIPYSKLFHMFADPVNLSLTTSPPGVVTVEEKESARGAFDRTELVSMDACTRCNRCEVVCPSFAAGEPLSPRELVLQMKGFAHREYAVDHARWRDVPSASTVEEAAQAGGAWYCTTCIACFDACPVGISAADIARDSRAVMVEGGRQVPRTIRDMLGNVGRHGNPWEPRGARHFAWEAGLEAKDLSAGDEAPLCLYTNNLSSGDERNQQVVKALGKVLKAAKVEFAILGKAEPFYGEEVRRVGEDGLFEGLVEETYGTLAEFGVSRVVTASPHAYHTFKNEYPQLKRSLKLDDAPDISAQHHTQLLARLLRDGDLKLAGRVEKRVAFHDPCYLGRHNGEYESPRSVLRSIPGVDLVELPRYGRDSFCCGGGGGRMWLESETEHRISELRALDAVKAGVQVLVTACPYCMSNLTDGIKVAGHSETIEVKDVAELVAEAL
ncbi:MAG TPA: heterodisulfide reductase-related iron-sulfur binding cluster [Chloroflexota bacterium]